MEQETPQSELEAAYVVVAGARVYYLHAGSGPPMLLIHGLVGSSEDWRAILPALARNASVYAIDLVNMGKSQRVDGLDEGLKATAKRIIAIMDALGLPQADIVGHSHGGAVALMLAARCPRRVRRLILFAPANPYSRSSDWMARVYSTPWGRLAARLLPYVPAHFQRLALGRLYGGADRIADSSLQQYVDVLRNVGSLRHVLAIVRNWFADRARLRRALSRVVRIPTLLVWGDRDYTVGLGSGARLHRKLRASDLIVVPGAGHSVFEDSPEEASRIVLGWLRRHPFHPALSTPLPVRAPVPPPVPQPAAAAVAPVELPVRPAQPVTIAAPVVVIAATSGTTAATQPISSGD